MIEKPFDLETFVFYGLTANATLYVPAGTEDLYKAKEGWKKFKYIVKEHVAVTGLTLNNTKIGLKEGEAFKLIVTVLPEKAENKSVMWSSSDNTIATVDVNGLVKGIKYGKTIITCTSAEDPSIFVKCTVNVRAVASVIIGDLNGDDEIDVTDVVELIDMVLGGIYDPAGDINGDGEVDVTDVVELIDMVLAGG